MNKAEWAALVAKKIIDILRNIGAKEKYRYIPKILYSCGMNALWHIPCIFSEFKTFCSLGKAVFQGERAALRICHRHLKYAQAHCRRRIEGIFSQRQSKEGGGVVVGRGQGEAGSTLSLPRSLSLSVRSSRSELLEETIRKECTAVRRESVCVCERERMGVCVSKQISFHIQLN